MGDLISRQTAIDAVKSLPDCANGYSDTYDKEMIVAVLEDVPSAQRTGRWIGDDEAYYCSECKKHAYGNNSEIITGDFKHCPFCGARMEVEIE